MHKHVSMLGRKLFGSQLEPVAKLYRIGESIGKRGDTDTGEQSVENKRTI